MGRDRPAKGCSKGQSSGRGSQRVAGSLRGPVDPGLAAGLASGYQRFEQLAGLASPDQGARSRERQGSRWPARLPWLAQTRESTVMPQNLQEARRLHGASRGLRGRSSAALHRREQKMPRVEATLLTPVRSRLRVSVLDCDFVTGAVAVASIGRDENYQNELFAANPSSSEGKDSVETS